MLFWLRVRLILRLFLWFWVVENFICCCCCNLAIFCFYNVTYFERYMLLWLRVRLRLRLFLCFWVVENVIFCCCYCCCFVFVCCSNLTIFCFYNVTSKVLCVIFYCCCWECYICCRSCFLLFSRWCKINFPGWLFVQFHFV